MPVDYSKWDKLELSDDSDIEVHPNVDKRSFIKWKQESIHQEREQRRAKIEFLQNETARHTRLLEQLNNLIDACKNEGTKKVVEDITNIRNKIREEGSADTPIPNANNPNGIPFDAILGSLLQQIEVALKTQSEEDVKKNLVERMEESRKKVQKQQDDMLAELSKEQKEASKKITSDNMFHESYNKTMISKASPAPSKPEPKGKEKKTTKVIETLNPGSVKAASTSQASAAPQVEAEAGDEEEEDDITVSPLAKEFAKLSGFEQSFRFVGRYPEIVSETYSDQLLAEAFTEQLEGNEKYARNCVYQSLILQYCGQLGKDGINLFFARMSPNAPNPQPRRLFEDDVNKTYSRIKTRCAEIRAEKEQQVETIQLQQMQEGSKLTVRVPSSQNEEEKQAAEIYNSLPPKFRVALETGELEEINKVLAEMKVEDAELVVKVASDYGFLDVEGEVLEEAPEQAAA
ncbi:hsp90 co-chaperone Cdc37 [Umbelopsis sp. WA50703]